MKFLLLVFVEMSISVLALAAAVTLIGLTITLVAAGLTAMIGVAS